MVNYSALSSIVFMMGFVFLFDGLHQRNRLTKLFRSISLCSPEEVNQVQAIWAACQDS
jgi:hypothetical protein